MITLSNRTYGIVGFTIAIGILGQWFEGPLPALSARLWTLPAVLLIAAVWAERALLASMQWDIHRQAPSEVYLGEGFSAELVLTNYAANATHIECQPSYPQSLAADSATRHYVVPPAESVLDRLELLPVELGSTALGDIHVRVRGFLGLVWWYRRISDDAVVEVVPRTMTHISTGRGDRLLGARYSRRPVQGGIEFFIASSVSTGRSAADC